MLARRGAQALLHPTALVDSLRDGSPLVHTVTRGWHLLAIDGEARSHYSTRVMISAKGGDETMPMVDAIEGDERELEALLKGPVR